MTPAPGSNEGKLGFLLDCVKAGLHPAEYEAGCEWVVSALWRDYIHNGVDAFWEAAIAVYDYAVHIPTMQATQVNGMNAWLVRIATTP